MIYYLNFLDICEYGWGQDDEFKFEFSGPILTGDIIKVEMSTMLFADNMMKDGYGLFISGETRVLGRSINMDMKHIDLDVMSYDLKFYLSKEKERSKELYRHHFMTSDSVDDIFNRNKYNKIKIQ